MTGDGAGSRMRGWEKETWELSTKLDMGSECLVQHLAAFHRGENGGSRRWCPHREAAETPLS